MNFRRVIFYLFLFSLCCLPSAIAENSERFLDLQDNLRQEISSNNLEGLKRAGRNLLQYSGSRGIIDVTGFPEELLRQAGFFAGQGKDELADILIEIAQDLNPKSAKVSFMAMGVGIKLGRGLEPEKLLEALSLTFTNLPDTLTFIKNLCLIIGWALVLGVIFSAGFILALNGKCVRDFLANKLNLVGYPIVRFIYFSVVVLPVLFGPLWTLVAWSLLTLPLGQKAKRLVLFAGLSLILFALLLSLQYRISSALNDADFWALIRVQGGLNFESDIEKLKNLYETIEDPKIDYQRAVLLKGLGRIDEAAGLFESLTNSDDLEMFVSEQGNLIPYYQGDQKTSEEHCRLIDYNTKHSPEFLFVCSKILFQSFDRIKSGELIQKLSSINQTRLKELERQEEYQKADGNNELPEIRLPDFTMFKLAVAKNLNPDQKNSPAGSPLLCFVLGIALVITTSFIKYSVQKQIHEKTKMSFLTKLVPGAMFFGNGHYFTFSLIMSICIFLAFPLLKWPKLFSNVFHHLPELYPLYVIFCLFILIIFSLINFFSESN